jgi:hypothetical protein
MSISSSIATLLQLSMLKFPKTGFSATSKQSQCLVLPTPFLSEAPNIYSCPHLPAVRLTPHWITLRRLALGQTCRRKEYRVFWL